jgi:hypothetical protein
MSMYRKLFEGTVGVVVAATAVTVGVVFGLGPARDESSGARASRRAAPVAVEPRAAGDAAVPRCDLLPEHYVPRDEEVVGGGAGTGVNVWAAGDAAVARYLNELARICASVGGAP